MAQAKTETVRIAADTKRRLAQIAEDEGKPLTAVLSEAVDHYEREVFFRKANAAYLRGRLNREQRKEELRELALLDGPLMDGLEDS